MNPVGSLTDLLFELSSEERIAILGKLREKPLKLSHIATKLKITVAEASRHLQRLSENGLIQKDSDGLYKVTPYGSLVLALVPGLDCISQNKTYFMEHDIFVLPREFIDRISVLYKSTFLSDTISNFAYEEVMFRKAEEFCWALADQVHWSATPIISEKLKAGIQFRSILPENIVPPIGYHPAEGVERRLLPKVNVIVIVTDKEAVFGLPYLNGKMDYSWFNSDEENFLKWCQDIHAYYWERAKPLVGPFPNLR
jgi:predicted transcriptional regulator